MEKLNRSHKELSITIEQEVNLSVLRDYLLSGELRAGFNMRSYADSFFNTGQNCGSVGCAVGHGPYAGIKKKSTESWRNYSYRAFGAGPVIFDFLFGAIWATINNTPQGAANRISYVLEYGIPERRIGTNEIPHTVFYLTNINEELNGK